MAWGTRKQWVAQHPWKQEAARGRTTRELRFQALAHAPLAHQSSLIKHKFKGKMVDNLKTATREQ